MESNENVIESVRRLMGTDKIPWTDREARKMPNCVQIRMSRTGESIEEAYQPIRDRFRRLGKVTSQ